MKVTDIAEETDSIRILREFYNANCLDKPGRVFFADLTDRIAERAGQYGVNMVEA